jgi:hypothetical protein
LPPELKEEGDGNENEAQVFPLYVKMWILELRLLLRRPFMSVNPETNFSKESRRICTEPLGKCSVSCINYKSTRALILLGPMWLFVSRP